jgi:DNA-binding LytR/AlgR family response regulator
MKQQLFFHCDKLEIPNKWGNIEIIKFQDIAYITYEKPYSIFFCLEKQKIKKILFPVSLTCIEQNFPPVFFRCNPAVIINFCYLEKISYSKNQLLMEDGESFSLSRRKVQDFKERKALLDRLAPLHESCLSCINSCHFQENIPPGISRHTRSIILTGI